MNSVKKKLITLIIGLSTLVGLSPLLSLDWHFLVLVAIILVGTLIVWGWWDIRVPQNISLRNVAKFTSSYDRLIFVYGSLLVRDSLLRTWYRNSSDLVCISGYLWAP